MFITNLLWNYVLCFCMYFAMLWIVQLNKSNQLVDEKGSFPRNSGNLLGLQIAGILWLGVVPLIWATPLIDLIIGKENSGPVFNFSVSAFTIILIYIGKLHGKRQLIASNLNTALPKSYYIRYLILRMLFLVSYEIFFRGLLLFVNAEKMGITIAIFTDMMLNTVLHFFSSKKMMWAYIPFFILCCILNYQAQAVWPSIALHLAISLSFELTIVKRLFNPIKVSS